MELIDVLTQARAEVLDDAVTAVLESDRGHYRAVGPEELRSRLGALFDIVLDCLQSRNLDQVVKYAEHLGRDRFTSGFGIGEVQTAFNVLEESMWHQVVVGVPTTSSWSRSVCSRRSWASGRTRWRGLRIAREP